MKPRNGSRCLLAAALTSLVVASGCGGGGGGGGAGAAAHGPFGGQVLAPESSWLPGQASLLSVPAFRTIELRAEVLAQTRERARDLELARIEAARLAAARRAKEEALRKYREAKRRAELAYKAALRRAARLRKLEERRLAALRRKRARELAALRKKLQVKPGEECQIPEVAARFHCETGMTPLAHPLPRK